MTNFNDFEAMMAAHNAKFEAQVAEMKAKHATGVAEMYAVAEARRAEMAAERAATDAAFQERLSALEEKELAANVDRLVSNICMLLNTTRRFS